MTKDKTTSNQPRKHHYVPRFYISRFSAQDGQLWVYDRAWKTYRRKFPKSICYETDLYTASAYNGKPADARIESEYLAGIDGLGAEVLRREFDTRTRFDGSRVSAFSFYLAHQWTRLPAFRKMILGMHQITGEEMLRIGFKDADRAKEILEDYPEILAEATAKGVTAESMAKTVSEGRVKVSVSETPFLKGLITHSRPIQQLMENWEWEVLVAPQSTGFITCDNPITMVPPEDFQVKPRDNGVGFGVPGCVKYFPLGRRMCLKIGDRGHGFSYRSIDGVAVRIINQNLAVNSERYILGQDRPQLEAVVGRSHVESQSTIERITVSLVSQTADGSLMAVQQNRRERYFYPQR